MSNGKIFYNNLTANSTITVTPPQGYDGAAVGFDCQYLGNNNPGVVWRSATNAAHFIDMVFETGGAPVSTPITGIVIMNHNLVENDTLTLCAANDAAFTSGVLGPVTIPWQKGFMEVSWSKPYYRLEVAKTSGEYIQVGEIFLVGCAYEFIRNYNWNYAYTREITRNSKETTSGQIYRKTRFIRRIFDLDVDGISDTQKEIFEDISLHDYICFLPNGVSGELYYGIIDFSTYTHVYNNYWAASITFMENPK